MIELHRFGGTVSDRGGAPIFNAWVAMPEFGSWTSSDAGGRFVFDRVTPGTHRILARTADGSEVSTMVSVPGGRADLVIGPSGGARKRSARTTG
jgi:hypothetical protein